MKEWVSESVKGKVNELVYEVMDYLEYTRKERENIVIEDEYSHLTIGEYYIQKTNEKVQLIT